MITVGYGYLVDDLKLEEVTNGEKTTHVAKFRLSTSEHISDDKRYTHYIPCEVWDSAAEYLVDNAKRGDYIYIEATLRQHRWKNDEEFRSKLVLRVKEFRIFKNEKISVSN